MQQRVHPVGPGGSVAFEPHDVQQVAGLVGRVGGTVQQPSGLSLSAGNHTLRAVVVGKNAGSTGYSMVFDRFDLVRVG
ncbi:hypothetical protein ACFYUR_15845 [Micromonospora haikouensis]|uniref:hypothetical protein n=1 Tax=Micromonospora TaxID=1873 RepID=UPI001E4BB3CC|nr:hypothetical protein [Micromonospora sp. NBRC 110038]